MDTINGLDEKRAMDDHISLTFSLGRIRATLPFSTNVSVLLGRIVDWSIAALVFVAPLFMAGRHPAGKLVVVICVVTGVLAWSIGQMLRPQPGFRRSGAEAIFLAGICLLLVQLIPLPAALRDHISPTLGEVLPAWTAQTANEIRFGEWPVLTVAPMVTPGRARHVHRLQSTVSASGSAHPRCVRCGNPAPLAGTSDVSDGRSGDHTISGGQR